MEERTPLDKPEVTPEKAPRWCAWLKRLGVAGFMFFLIKGLAWLAIFAGVGKCVME
ncbi:MAG: hypothetical protein JNK77_15395 [Saprospiraceae bacterium]|nr:hypothetical protein [Saprospiraceae bacterium]